MKETNDFYADLFPKTVADLDSSFSKLVFYTYFFYCYLNALPACDFTRSESIRPPTDIVDCSPSVKMTFVENGTLHIAYQFCNDEIWTVFTADTLSHVGYVCNTFENSGVAYMATVTLSSEEISRLMNRLESLEQAVQRPRRQQRFNAQQNQGQIQPEQQSNSRQARTRRNNRRVRVNQKEVALDKFRNLLNNMPKDANPTTFANFPWAPGTLLSQLPATINVSDDGTYTKMLNALVEYGRTNSLTTPELVEVQVSESTQ
jgi:hypothetical protein